MEIITNHPILSGIILIAIIIVAKAFVDAKKDDDELTLS